VYVGHFNGQVAAHAFAPVHALSMGQLLFEITVELIEDVFPIAVAIGDFVELAFKISGKRIIHQVAKVFAQAIGDDVAHFFGIQAAVFEFDVTPDLGWWK
jgi:hypothetical protein